MICICQYDLRSGLLLIRAKNRDESLSEYSWSFYVKGKYFSE